ncbi:MAG TPA: carboxylating nicotinate-nucleotide diphosphorylase [Bacteroidota bacterium]|nr:carboxylating nicotinate-nucleotide diphosphorylase [Bacteroidota bacterium]
MNEFHANSKINHLLEEALLEDIGMGDITTESTVAPDVQGRGNLLFKESGVVAGLSIIDELFRIVDHELVLQASLRDGEQVAKGTKGAVITGSLASILKGERVALNILQRMSGIATLTRKFVDEVKHTSAKITDTRKTAPGLRMLDKLAVNIGGGINHRFGLDDMILIKDNHIAAAGGIGIAIEKCLAYRSSHNYPVQIEVETKNLAEVREALAHAGIQRIMLDNFTIPDMIDAVRLIAHKVEVEASGNVTLQTVRAIAETGVDIISVGALTHSAPALDISLKIEA